MRRSTKSLNKSSVISFRLNFENKSVAFSGIKAAITGASLRKLETAPSEVRQYQNSMNKLPIESQIILKVVIHYLCIAVCGVAKIK